MPFWYVPEVEASPLSEMRLAAYKQESAIPGPLADPTAWQGFTLKLFIATKKRPVDTGLCNPEQASR